MTKFRWAALFAAALIGSWGASPAAAAGSAMQTGARTTQPVGHYELCQSRPEECRQKSPRRAPVELSRRLWAEMIAINDSVNATVAPMTDMEMWGRQEVWSYPAGQGDCEDYALEKRRQLMAIGVPSGDVLMTVVRQPNGDGHAVLTVRTSLGDFVLDNLETHIAAWEDTPYTFLKRQSEYNSGVWVKITDDRAESVASIH
jgi:predicted transglutaminase-like cysteine proteinase